jgi:hypothetical protein
MNPVCAWRRAPLHDLDQAGHEHEPVSCMSAWLYSGRIPHDLTLVMASMARGL